MVIRIHTFYKTLKEFNVIDYRLRVIRNTTPLVIYFVMKQGLPISEYLDYERQEYLTILLLCK